jgi:Family of unknown function (DUF6152)
MSESRLTTPSAPASERGHFLTCRSHPSYPRRGLRCGLTQGSPLLEQEGWPRHQTLERRGRGGHSAALFILGFLLCVTPLSAHHSTARYDLSKTVVVQGTVTEVLWQNPHIILVMNDTKGQEQAFEAPSPVYIVNSGWMKDTIKPGDKVTVKGNPAKNGELPMYLVTVTLANGKEYSPKNPER